MEILGLPLHPLVVHAVVVLVPLSAFGSVAIALVRWARLRYGGLVVAGSFVAMASTILAQLAGTWFAEQLPRHTEAMLRHFELGDDLLLWTIVMFAGTLVVMVAQRMIDQENPRGRVALVAGAVVSVVSAVVSVVQTVRIGHSGSAAVWEGILG